MRTRRICGWPSGRAVASTAWRGPSGSRPIGSTIERAGAVGAALDREARDRAGAVGIGAGKRDQAHVAARQFRKHRGDIGVDRFEQCGRELAREEIGQHRGIDQAANERIVRVGRRADVLAGARRLRRRHRDVHLFEIARRAKRLEDLRRVLIVTIRGGLRAGLCGEARQRELADRRLIALADQLEDARALRDVVIRLGRARLARAQIAAQSQELAPRAGRGARIETRLHLRQAMLGLVDASGGQQRFGGDQLGFDRFRRRRVGRLGDLVGDRERFVGLAAPRREARADHAQRPLIPAARVASVGAVGFGRLPQVLRGVFVVAAHQRHLRQRVVDRAGRLVELHRAADIERAVQHGVGAIEIADAHADLSERRERNGEAGALSKSLVQVDRALGERERLFVAVANQRDVRLVAVDRREHIIGLENRGHALGLAQRGVGFVVASGLREHHRRQRMHHREVALVAGGVQRGGGFGNVLAHDGHVADLPIALAEIEVGEADRARVVRDLGLLQGAVVQRDRPRLLAARKRDAAVQAPQIRVHDRGNVVAQRVRRTAEHGSGLCKIPLQEVRFSQHDPDTELVIPGERRGRPQQGRKQLDGGGGLPAL